MAYSFAFAPEEIKDFHVAIVVFRHLLAFAFANATRDCTPPYGLEKALVRLVMLG